MHYQMNVVTASSLTPEVGIFYLFVLPLHENRSWVQAVLFVFYKYSSTRPASVGLEIKVVMCTTCTDVYHYIAAQIVFAEYTLR